MADTSKIIENFSTFEKAEKSISAFSNWIFGISSAVCVFVILKIEGNDMYNYKELSCLIIGLIIIAMANTLFTGILKYFVIKREIAMGIKLGLVKKMIMMKEIDGKDDIETRNKMGQNIDAWFTEHNKMASIGRALNISVITTLISILSIGIFILYSINHCF
jgi:hypothetical protein